jgi:GNAT superfamily N-acetyltransferase
MPSQSLSISFANAKPEDFEYLLALRIDAMRESLERIGRFDPARARERFLSGFEPDDTRHIEHEAQRVGFVVTKRQAECLLLDHLYIHPKYQSKGIGGAVVSQVISEANALHLPVRVGALRESDSNRFYIANGFQLVDHGEFDNYYIRPMQNSR